MLKYIVERCDKNLIIVLMYNFVVHKYDIGSGIIIVDYHILCMVLGSIHCEIRMWPLTLYWQMSL